MPYAETLNQIRQQISTHDCPNCGGLAYCAIKAGRAPSTCWCLAVDPPENLDIKTNDCLCKRCMCGPFKPPSAA
ncbi:cysteine-rich CWC family protein [Marinobacter psychrophilus]|jgi:hypothetical protein|uniref:cysteine-rich CWC family protein n=1 Tax=Marinobacter psychrophilus TaxID=330734 RepID=UPI001B43DA0F|nr:cysteine-rich CWC family protein [Marinobacter psychrophilus]MBQ0843649.1 cysteine-rich CWC family protein [Marinobacter psychrophilus]